MAARHSKPTEVERETDTSRATDVELDLMANTLTIESTIVTSKRLDVDGLFVEPDDPDVDARFKTAVDPGHGWSGFEIRQGTLLKVNYGENAGDGGEYLEERVTDEDHVVETIRELVEDENVGRGYGDFDRRRPGAGF